MAIRVWNEFYVDHDSGAVVINDSGLPMADVREGLRHHPEVAALTQWVRNTRSGPERRHGSLFERDMYVTPDNPYDQMRVAYAAESDDVVSSVLESTEALAFSRIELEATDEYETDVWNQIVEEIDLDSRMREIWREAFLTSNVYLAAWFGQRNFKVRGKTPTGKASKKSFENLMVPRGLSVLDPLRILPVGGLMFNKERLAWVADWAEVDEIDAYLRTGDPSKVDPIVARLIVGRYEPTLVERQRISGLHVDPQRLYLLDDRYCWRFTATRSQHERFATVRMKSIFPVLDLKQQLREMDRAHLLGATNFIVLVKKGTDKQPANQGEVDNLKVQVRMQSRTPVLVGDHRLSVEIITPKTDGTLNAEKYAGLDVRISGRLYGFFITPHGGRGDDSVKLARVVARGLESKRDQQRRNLLRHLFKPTFEQNDAFTSMPTMRFFPKRIALDFDPALAAYLLDLFTQGAISRDSILAEVDYEQEEEFAKRKYEMENYDDVFMPPVLPAGSPGVNPGATTPPNQPGKTDPKAGGRQKGGRRAGGGAAPGSGQGQPPRAGKPATKPTGTAKKTRTAAVAEDRAAERDARREREQAEDAAVEAERRRVAAEVGEEEGTTQDIEPEETE